MATPITRVATCPPGDVLGQLVSGSLHEEAAEKLFLHIETCVRCQLRMDQLEQDSDDFLAAARQRAGTESDKSQLSNLIRRAQKIGTDDAAESPGTREPVSMNGFVSGLRRCGLFGDEEIDSLVSDFGGSDSSSMARLLVGRKKLTPFQARVLLKGRWKGLVLGNYVILDKLGQGGMGSVFKARHRRLGRIVCVKVVNSAGRKSPQMLERFRNEARTIAALSHPNFVVAHDADEAEGVPFLVMEYVEGCDLARQVSGNGPLPLHLALQIIQQAATALQYAHDQGVTHRDIKPHNLLISEDSDSSEFQVKILDLGLARFDSLLGESEDAPTHAAITNTGVIMGTVDYMSPEQAMRSRDADNRSDIYSLGCTLHYLATGQPVFSGDTLMARLIAHRETEVPSLENQCPGAMPDLDAVFHRMLAKAPADRYQSMQAVAEDVDALLTGRPPAARADAVAPCSPSSVLRQRQEQRRRPAWRSWVVMGICFCLFVTALWVLSTDPSFGILTGDAKMAAAMMHRSGGTAGQRGPAAQSTGLGIDPGAVMAGPFEAGLFAEDLTMAHGGTPRALAILPQQYFDDREFRSLQGALERRGIALKVAAPRAGSLTPMHDLEFPLAADIAIQDVLVDNFDMIFVVGGSTEDFESHFVSDQLSLIVPSSEGLHCVIGAASLSGVKVLEKLGLIDRCREKQENGIFFGRLGLNGGAMVWGQKPESIDLLVEKAYSMRAAALDRTIHWNTLAGNGEGRALVVVPQNGFRRHQYKLLQTVFEKRGIDSVVASTSLGDAQPAGGSGKKLAVEMPLTEFQPDDSWLFAHRFDYVILVGGGEDALKKESGDELRQLLTHAVRDGSIVIGLSQPARDIMDLCPDIARTELVAGQGAWYGRPDGCEGTVALVHDLKSDVELEALLIEAERLRRAAIAEQHEPEAD